MDEIGLIPLEAQEKILRVVEYGSYERVGSSVTHECDVRIIGATNADLKALCGEGKFKEDLLDRLSFEVFFVPPLRERGEDILLLASRFAAKMAAECGIKETPVFSDSVIDLMMSYSWPGNVRELKNVVERAVYRSGSSLIDELELDPFQNPFKKREEERPLSSLEKAREELDISYLKRALKESGGNQKAAASFLGLSYDQFRGLYRKYKDRLS